MTAGTWFKLVRNSVLAAALITAAQVGIGSGVGVIDWGHGLVDAGAWRDLLTWVAFVFAVGVLGGAAVGQRLFPGRIAANSGYPSGGRLGGLAPAVRFWLRVTAAVSAGLGALAAFPLVWLPVLVARPTVDLRPQATIGLAAGAGLVIGLLLCITALAWGAVAAGSTLASAWVWLLALTCAALGAVNHVQVSPDLGLLDAPQLIPASAWWLGPYFMVVLAAILGLAVAAAAGWRGATWPGIALSGVVGPVLVAAAYAVTGWILPATGLTVIRGDTSAVRAATLVAIAVGALVSVCVAVPQVRRHRVIGVVTPMPPRPSRPVAIEPPRPLAISASPAAAYAPYVLEHTGQEAPYRREPAYYTDPVYLEPTADYPSPEPRRTASPAGAYTADPYSSDAFTVTAQTFDADVFPAAPAPLYRPTPRTAPVLPPPALPPPVLPPPVAPAPAFAAPARASAVPAPTPPVPAAPPVPPVPPVPASPPPVSAVPVSRPPVSAVPAGPVYGTATVTRTAGSRVTGPTKIPAAPATAPVSAARASSPVPAPPGPVSGPPAHPVSAPPGPVSAPPGPVSAPPGPVSAPPGPVSAPPGPVSAPPVSAPPGPGAARTEPVRAEQGWTIRVPLRSELGQPDPVPRPTAAYVAPSRLVEEGYAQPAAPMEPGYEERVYRETAGAAVPPTAAPPVPDSKRRDRKAARAAKNAAATNAAATPAPAQPVSPLLAGSIEGEIVAGSTSPAAASTGPSTPTSPASGSTPATPTGPGRTPSPGGRRNRKSDDKQLRKGERDHIDWINNLVSIEADAELKTSKER